MAQRKIIWSNSARIKLYKILEFYIERNKNKTYSTKLYENINKDLKLLIKHPDLGIKTEIESVRALIAGDFIIFYENFNNKIIIHTLWDSRQNPDDLTITD
ncbi:MAG: type II toxin-antitoxin system RelE/ParE family toxin [Bacteroidetes bacterium]|nr:type II toxin-antitoxin system RelE/ParE family toxin [Bacteroidota bacterium]